MKKIIRHISGTIIIRPKNAFISKIENLENKKSNIAENVGLGTERN